MSLITYTATLVLLCALGELTSGALPDYINVCKRDQETISDCIKKNVEFLMPYLAKGIPELNVPSIEPFHIPEVIAISGDLAILNASGKDFKVSGATSVIIKSFSMDLKTYTIRTKLRFPKLHLEGIYNVNTQILVLPIKGQGNVIADAVKCDADVTIKSKIEERDGKQYLKFTHMDLNISMKDYSIRLEGLFNGDKTLGDATNEIINQNKADFLKAVMPYLEKTVAKLLLDSANKITASTSLDELLPLPSS